MEHASCPAPQLRLLRTPPLPPILHRPLPPVPPILLPPHLPLPPNAAQQANAEATNAKSMHAPTGTVLLSQNPVLRVRSADRRTVPVSPVLLMPIVPMTGMFVLPKCVQQVPVRILQNREMVTIARSTIRRSDR